jgi:hypothetical protein
VLAAVGEWRERYTRLPSSYEWSHTDARRRGGEALDRFAAGEVTMRGTPHGGTPVPSRRGDDVALQRTIADVLASLETVDAAT